MTIGPEVLRISGYSQRDVCSAKCTVSVVYLMKGCLSHEVRAADNLRGEAVGEQEDARGFPLVIQAHPACV